MPSSPEELKATVDAAVGAVIRPERSKVIYLMTVWFAFLLALLS